MGVWELFPTAPSGRAYRTGPGIYETHYHGYGQRGRFPVPLLPFQNAKPQLWEKCNYPPGRIRHPHAGSLCGRLLGRDDGLHPHVVQCHLQDKPLAGTGGYDRHHACQQRVCLFRLEQPECSDYHIRRICHFLRLYRAGSVCRPG